MQDKENMMNWILDSEHKRLWKTPFRLYSRIHVTNFFSVKGMSISLLFLVFLVISNGVLGNVIFPQIFGLSITKGQVLFDCLFFGSVFLLNTIASYQAKGADDAIYKSLKFDQKMLLGCLAIYAGYNLLYDYSSEISTVINSFVFSLGLINCIMEVDFTPSALKSRKEQIQRLQDHRELQKYIKGRMKKLEMRKALYGSLTPDEMENKQNYSKVLASSEKEYNYLYNVLKGK